MNARMTRHPVTGHYTRQTRTVIWNGKEYTQYRAYNSKGNLVWVTIPR